MQSSVASKFTKDDLTQHEVTQFFCFFVFDLSILLMVHHVAFKAIKAQEALRAFVLPVSEQNDSVCICRNDSLLRPDIKAVSGLAAAICSACSQHLIVVQK